MLGGLHSMQVARIDSKGLVQWLVIYLEHGVVSDKLFSTQNQSVQQNLVIT